MRNILEIIKNIILNHRWAIIGSFCLTVMIFMPLLAFPQVIKGEYRGINISHFGTDTHFYLTRGEEVLSGNNLGNPLFREGKNNPDSFSSYSEYILLTPIKLLGLAQITDIVTIYNIYNFIGIFLLILLIYWFTWQLSGNKLLSAAAALFVIGGYSIIYWKALFYSDFNVYARSLNPYISSLAFFLYLNFLVKSLKSNELKNKIFAALAFGLLFYIYFFAWSFALVLNASLFLILLFKKDIAAAKNILAISLGGLILGSYNLIGLFLSFASEWGRQTAYFNWMSYGHEPIFSKIGFAALILAAIFAIKIKSDKNLSLILAIIIGGWLALNQQIITGRMLQYGHYYWYFIVPLSIIIGFYMIWFLIKNENLKKWLFVIVIAVAFINTAGGQYRSFFTTLEAKRYEQKFRPLIDVLNKEKVPAVILGGDEANAYLFTIYTPHDLFWHTAASFSQTPIQRFKDALFVYAYLNKEIRNDFRDYFESARDDKNDESLYLNLYRNLEGYWSGYSYYEYNDKVASGDAEIMEKGQISIDQLSWEYEELTVKNSGIYDLLKKYGVNYIVWDKNKFPEWDLSVISNLELAADSSGILLYQLN